MIKKALLYLTFLVIAVSGYADTLHSSIRSNKLKETLVDVNHAKLFCRSMGEGSPLIVLHGGPGLTQDYLLPQLYKLAENHFVVFYDQRGCGQSTGEINFDTINIETFVNDLDAIRKAFHFDKTSILGHSWGGYLAMEYAIAHPESIDKLVLANSMPASSDSEGLALFVEEWTRRMAPFQKEVAEIQQSKEFHEGDPDTVEHYYRIIFGTYCYLPEKADLLNLRMTRTAAVNGTKVYACLSKNFFSKDYDLHPELRKLKVSTLVLHGDADPIPAATAKSINNSISNSRYILMENCGHFPYVEDPDAFFRHLNDFLN